MIVGSTGKNLKATFINATPDYTGGDNLTFSMSPIVAKMFAKHYGAPPEDISRASTSWSMASSRSS